MALQLAANDIVIARAWSVLDEQAAVNTYGYFVTNIVGGGVTDQDFCNDFDTLFTSPFYQALQPDSVEYRGVQVYFLRRAGFLPAPVKSTLGAHVGTVGTVPMPRDAAPIMKYAGFNRGPGGRGRLYLPFVSSDYLAINGRLTPAFDTIVNSVCATLLNPITITRGAQSATLVWSLIRRFRDPVPGVSSQVILTAEAANKIGQMHKRGDYGRANESPI